MSRIFKSNYVKIGTPKPIKTNTPPVVRHVIHKSTEEEMKSSAEKQANDIIEDAKELYLRIIEEANAEAKKVMEQAKAEIEEIRENAGEAGYREGFDSGYTEGINHAQDVINQATDIKKQLDERSAELYYEAEGQIMELVLEIANKVLGQELIQNSETIMALVKQAISRCTFKEKLIIRVAEDDYDCVNSNKEKLIMLTEGVNGLEIYCDKALTKGGCIVETSAGEINAGVNVQMKEIRKAFEYLIRNE